MKEYMDIQREGESHPVFLKVQGALRRNSPLEPSRKARAFFQKAHYT